MDPNWKRAMVTSLILVLSSLAGCLGNDMDEEDVTVMVSTYHIGQLVKAIAGDDVDMEFISQDNIPVHDYEPSTEDLIRLGNADVFFYHGLGLEPWVDAALASLGEDAPPAVKVHTMPSGSTALDYESMLVNDLCELMAEGPFEDRALVDDEDHAEDAEIDDGYTAYRLAFPEGLHHDEEGHDDEGHDEEHHDEEGHDEDHHDEEGHDEEHHDEEGHDEEHHDEHDHLGAEDTIEDACATTADTTVSIFHLEEGEYLLEFESEDMDSEFTMAVLKMGGGHAHHDHGDDEHGDDDHDDGDHGDGHGDEDHEGVCHDMSDHSNNEIDNEADCEAAGFVWMEEEHDDEMTAEEAMDLADTNDDNRLSWNEFWAVWSEDDDHHEEHHDENGTEEDGHDDHENHGEEEFEEIEMMVLMSYFNESDADGDALLDLAELETFIHLIEEMEDEAFSVEIMMMIYDEDGDGVLSMSEFAELLEMEEDEEHDDHGHEDGNETHDEGNETHDEEEEAFTDEMIEMMFDALDANNDSMLDADELRTLMEMEDDHAGAYASLHVRVEGEYGIALPAGVTLHILSEEGHEGHDHDEGDHEEGDHEEGDHEEGDHEEGDHEEGDHEEDDHDEGDHDDGDSVNYDPHSWLSPRAFNAQVQTVLDGLTAAFPDREATFTANAADYTKSLMDLDDDYKAAFGENGTCTAQGKEMKVAANHNAYSYLADAYGLKFVTVHGLDPEGEPSPQDIAEVVEFITEEDIQVLFVEEYTDASAVQSIVDETGVSIQTLYTMELAPTDANDDYLSMMGKNLDNLVAGIGC